MRSFNPASLRAARLAAGLTQAEVAKRAGMARTNYVNLEAGGTNPGLHILPRLAKAVGVEPRELIDLHADEVTLRDLREWAGLSQTETARALGFKSATSYARIETGRTEPSAANIKALAKTFGVTIAQLEHTLAKQGV